MNRNHPGFRSFLVAASLLLLGAALFASLVLLTRWEIAIASIAAVSVLAGVAWRRLGQHVKRTISENVFLIISGIAAFLIVLFVLYFLTHIFLLGKAQLSWEFLFSAPREGLTEGGIFPAIVGTALLVIIMSLFGVPVGTVTAIYLTEYAGARSLPARIIRFAVNTLAGVPAIVFGLFGLGFFIGTFGNQIDTWQAERRFERMEALIASPASPFRADGRATSGEIRSLLERDDREYWSDQIELTGVLEEMKGSGEMRGAEAVQYFSERTRPHWGQPSLIWAALTMALLTLPVVIVSVEEAIKTVPRDLREASLALGATKWRTIRQVVIPGAFTGILTGGILAVSRGAGEVAPILFTGAAYYLPELPKAATSQFMELGYHIYVLTTQSTDVEATKPILYATTFVLLVLTFALNFSAIFLRSRVRKRLAQIGT